MVKNRHWYSRSSGPIRFRTFWSIYVCLMDVRKANLDPNSTVIFRVVKSKVALDMTPAQYNKIKGKR